MAKVDVKDLMNTLSNIWVVEFLERDRWSGPADWVVMFDNYKEASEEARKTNSRNTSLEAPDYYIMAKEPKLFADYYGIKLR